VRILRLTTFLAVSCVSLRPAAGQLEVDPCIPVIYVSLEPLDASGVVLYAEGETSDGAGQRETKEVLDSAISAAGGTWAADASLNGSTSDLQPRSDLALTWLTAHAFQLNMSAQSVATTSGATIHGKSHAGIRVLVQVLPGQSTATSATVRVQRVRHVVGASGEIGTAKVDDAVRSVGDPEFTRTETTDYVVNVGEYLPTLSFYVSADLGESGDLVAELGVVIEVQPDPCCNDPCCGDPCCGDPCCGDPCCQNPACCNDPCCGDPCCGDPCCANPACCNDPCCGDPCCGDPCCQNPACCNDPCCGDPCCGDPCCGDPCCNDPCCTDPVCCGDPCCGDPCCDDPCCEDPACCFDPCCGDPCCNDPCCANPECCGDPCCDVDCDDNNACTTDGCNSNGCFNTPIDCNDGDPCTIDGCNPLTGCTHVDITGTVSISTNAPTSWHIVFVNDDDEDNPANNTADMTDLFVNGSGDVPDIFTVNVNASPWGAEHSVRLSGSSGNGGRVRVFDSPSASGQSILDNAVNPSVVLAGNPPWTLGLEGMQAGHVLLKVEHFCGDDLLASAIVPIYVIRTDIDVDSNNDSVLDDKDEHLEMQNPGMLLRNGQWSVLSVPAAVPIGDGQFWTWKLDYPTSRVTVAATIGGPVIPSGQNQAWPPASVLYIRGDSVSATSGDVTISFTMTGAPIYSRSDAVKLTVFEMGVRDVKYLPHSPLLQVFRDTNHDVPFAPPQWVDLGGTTGGEDQLPDGDALDANEKQFPIVFVRNKHAYVETRLFFRPLDALTSFGDDLRIRGVRTGATLTWEKTATLDEPNHVKITNAQATPDMPNSVSALPMNVAWWLSVNDGDTWIGAGNTSNPCYVVQAMVSGVLDPGWKYTWTMFHLACSGAAQGHEAGETPTPAENQALVDKIFANFSTGSGPANVLRAEPPNIALKYYGAWNVGDTSSYTLFDSPTGDGQCGAWARLFRQCIRAHGIGSAEYIKLESTVTDEHFFVPSWSLLAAPPSPPYAAGGQTYTHRNIVSLSGVFMWPWPPPSFPWSYTWMYSEATDLTGLPGQNTGNPKSHFQNHQVIRFGNRYYDPSYGRSYESKSDLESAEIAGYARWEPAFTINEAADGVDYNGNGTHDPVYRRHVYFIRPNAPGDGDGLTESVDLPIFNDP